MEEIRLYILSINIKNSNFILGTKIEIEKREKYDIFYYEIKSRNEILFNLENNHLSMY